MTFVDELRQSTEELEALTEREIQIRESRGIPDHVPIVTTEHDAEVMQLVADQAAHRERYDALMRRETKRRNL